MVKLISFRVAGSSPGVKFYSVCSEYNLLTLVNKEPALAFGRDEFRQEI